MEEGSETHPCVLFLGTVGCGEINALPFPNESGQVEISLLHDSHITIQSMFGRLISERL